MMLAAPGLEKLEIPLRKAFIRLLILCVERVHKAVPEGVGVDVERTVDEVRDVRPEDVVALVELDRRPEAFAAHVEPDAPQLLAGEFALPALGVDLALEGVERDLAHHGVEHVLDLARQHGKARLGRIGRIEQRPEGQHLAENARRLGQRQRRRCHQGALWRGEPLVHAMSQLVRQRHHVAGPAEIVEHEVRMGAWDGRMGERARRLAIAHRGVDPAGVEKRLRHFHQFG